MMDDSAYLIFDKKGLIRLARGGARRGGYHMPQRPRLAQGEYAMFITVKVPASVFEPRPTPAATITVPEEKVLSPAVEVVVEEAPA